MCTGGWPSATAPSPALHQPTAAGPAAHCALDSPVQEPISYTFSLLLSQPPTPSLVPKSLRLSHFSTPEHTEHQPNLGELGLTPMANRQRLRLPSDSATLTALLLAHQVQPQGVTVKTEREQVTPAQARSYSLPPPEAHHLRILSGPFLLPRVHVNQREPPAGTRGPSEAFVTCTRCAA